MANEYIQSEVQKIMKDSKFEFPLNHAMASAWILANFKGEDLKVFNMKKTSSLCDYSILATAQNVTQARSMTDEKSVPSVSFARITVPSYAIHLASTGRCPGAESVIFLLCLLTVEVAQPP